MVIIQWNFIQVDFGLLYVTSYAVCEAWSDFMRRYMPGFASQLIDIIGLNIYQAGF